MLQLRIRSSRHDVLVLRAPRQIKNGRRLDAGVDDFVALCPGRALTINTFPHYYHLPRRRIHPARSEHWCGDRSIGGGLEVGIWKFMERTGAAENHRDAAGGFRDGFGRVSQAFCTHPPTFHHHDAERDGKGAVRGCTRGRNQSRRGSAWFDRLLACRVLVSARCGLWRPKHVSHGFPGILGILGADLLYPAGSCVAIGNDHLRSEPCRRRRIPAESCSCPGISITMSWWSG